MSIPVDLAALGEALARHDLAYLLTAGEARPHVAQVTARLESGVVVVAEPGHTARRVVPERPALSLLMPPRDPGGYTLIVDGEGSLGTDGELLVVPSHAVLHRASSASVDGAARHDSACGNDCRPIS